MERKPIWKVEKGEKFRIGKDWFVYIGINDGYIPQHAFLDFRNAHYYPVMKDSDLSIPVMCLTDQEFFYVNGEVIPDEWGSF